MSVYVSCPDAQNLCFSFSFQTLGRPKFSGLAGLVQLDGQQKLLDEHLLDLYIYYAGSLTKLHFSLLSRVPQAILSMAQALIAMQSAQPRQLSCQGNYVELCPFKQMNYR